MSTALVALTGREGVVRRDDGEVVVCWDVSDDRGQPLDIPDRYRPVKTWLHAQPCLVGGLLPRAAVSAEVIDDAGSRVAAAVGAGAYVAVLEQSHDGHEPVVCCRGDAGRPVRRPLPGDYPSAPEAVVAAADRVHTGAR
ncbi:MAG: hypothetical protein ACLP22_20390 [Solirubrobacteraceae bacterium]